MKMAHSLPVFEKFQVNGGTTSFGHMLTKYVQKLENLFVAMNFDRKKRKKHYFYTIQVTKSLKFIKLYQIQEMKMTMQRQRKL